MFALANTGVNLLYTTPSDARALIKSVQVTNSGANAVITLTTNNTTTSYNTAIHSLVTNTHATLLDSPMVLIESETLSIKSTVANAVSGIVSMLEISRN
jgi:pyruvate/2-oxoglutarate/acetoin dehydrogenase E1 component